MDRALALIKQSSPPSPQTQYPPVEIGDFVGRRVPESVQPKETGSDFDFPLGSLVRSRRRNTALPLEGPNTRFLASGRDALHWIIRTLGLAAGDHVLLPAYLCEDVLRPFLAHGLRVEFYGIGANLQVDGPDLATKLSPETRLVLYIPYFGFPTELTGEVVALASPQTTIVEDSSHAFLSSLGQSQVRSDIRFASYRKLLPVPYGAVVSWNADRLLDITPARTVRSMGSLGALSCRCAGAAFKNLWLRHPRLYPKAVFRKLFSWSEALLETYPKPAGMSAISRRMLGSLDLESVVESRRRNFQTLLSGLAGAKNLRPLHTSLPDGVCPLGFPILVEERDSLVRHLIKNQVYSPIHWDLPEAVDGQEFQDAWYVSSHILTIPVDQRYAEPDMARIVSLIHDHQGSEVPWAAPR